MTLAPRSATWQSANGLDWSALGEMTLASVELGDVTCFEVPGTLHGLSMMTVAGTVLSGPCSEGAVVGAGATYASLDGGDWTQLPFGDQAFAAAATMSGERDRHRDGHASQRRSEHWRDLRISEAP